MAFDWDDLDDTNVNSSMKSLRDHAKDLEKQLKAAAKREGELNTQLFTYKQAEKTQGLARKFEEQGLNEKQAKLFLALNPDIEEINLESIQEFAEEYGLTTPTKVEGENAPIEVNAETAGFVKVPNSIATPPDGKVLSSEEYESLLATDQTAALRAVQEGRVQLATSL